MDLNQMLESGGGIDAIAAQMGIPREQAQRGVQALLPSVAAGFGQKVQAEPAGGSGGLGDTLERLGGAGLSRNVIAPEPTEVHKGNDILGQIFGSKDVSRNVAGEAAQTSGLDPALLKKMLPIVAMLVGGYLSSRAGPGGAGGGLGGILGQVLGGMGGGGKAGSAGGAGGGLGGVLGSILGGGRR